jgi:broad specificity phosphatase PhoE
MNSKNYCNLYIVRHGETEWNVKKLVQGQTDIPLNKNGEWQAKQLAEQFKKIHFDAAYSSDLLRAKKTAEIIVLEKKITVETTKILREKYFGRFEGKHVRELDKKIDELIKLYGKEAKSEIEDDENLMKRFIPFLREVAAGHLNKNVLIVTHGGLMRIFLYRLGFGDSKSLPPGSISNTAYIKLLSDGVELIVKETFGIVKKLPE